MELERGTDLTRVDAPLPLAGKVAFITGATSGLGRAIALRLARDGARVVVHGRHAERGERVKREVEAAGSEAKVVLGDLASVGDVERVCKEAAEAFGRIDFLVNNAGIAHQGRFAGVKLDIVQKMLDVNIRAQILVTQRVLRKMRKNAPGPGNIRGRIVNMSSIGGKTGKAGKVIYDLTKFAMVGFTQALADELAPRGILVNGLAPGIIDTPIWGPSGVSSMRDPKKEVPLGRFGTPEEVAEVAAFLLDPRNTYMTGQVLTVSGGRERH
ncbi:MAG: SDR family NAD(P)-dependent oxidoreductase [Promethearchaeota archaeon]